VGQHAVSEFTRHHFATGGTIVKGGNQGEDRGAGVGRPVHVADMNLVERPLADAQHKRALHGMTIRHRWDRSQWPRSRRCQHRLAAGFCGKGDRVTGLHKVAAASNVKFFGKHTQTALASESRSTASRSCCRKTEPLAQLVATVRFWGTDLQGIELGCSGSRNRWLRST